MADVIAMVLVRLAGCEYYVLWQVTCKAYQVYWTLDERDEEAGEGAAQEVLVAGEPLPRPLRALQTALDLNETARQCSVDSDTRLVQP